MAHFQKEAPAFLEWEIHCEVPDASGVMEEGARELCGTWLHELGNGERG